MVFTRDIMLETQGNNDVVDLTPKVEKIVYQSGIGYGICSVFCPGSTGGITAIEFEGGAIEDFKRVVGALVPETDFYAHNERWGDGNGHSHIRAALLGPSQTFPVAEGQLVHGTWQQVVFVDFDVRPRSRRIVVTVVGDS